MKPAVLALAADDWTSGLYAGALRSSPRLRGSDHAGKASGWTRWRDSPGVILAWLLGGTLIGAAAIAAFFLK